MELTARAVMGVCSVGNTLVSMFWLATCTLDVWGRAGVYECKLVCAQNTFGCAYQEGHSLSA